MQGRQDTWIPSRAGMPACPFSTLVLWLAGPKGTQPCTAKAGLRKLGSICSRGVRAGRVSCALHV